MNNQELTFAVEQHQKWLENHETGEQLTLAGQQIVGFDFSKYRIDDAIMVACVLSGCNFNGVSATCCFAESYFDSCDFRNAHFERSDLHQVKIFKSQMDDIQLADCRLDGYAVDDEVLANFWANFTFL